MTEHSARRRIVLVSIDPWRQNGDFRPFDYGLRRIAAAIAGSKCVADEWDVHVLSRRDEDVDALVRDIRSLGPDVVGFSTYVWSIRPFLEVAAKLSAEEPRPVMLFGGPSARPVSFAREPLRSLSKHVDGLVLGDGEEIIVDILGAGALDRASLAAIEGVAVLGPLGWRGAKRDVSAALDELPSPYQLGLVPREATAHLEIFRGCPLSCSFCQWGSYDGARTASADYLKRELEAIARVDASGVFLVDAGLNLNSRAFRALSEAEREVGLLASSSLHCELYPKYVRPEHLSLLASTKAHVGIGVQSTDAEVLRASERPCSDIGRMTDVIREVATVADVLLEVIVGLPGDSPDGIKTTVEWARSFGVSVNAYHCLLLPDALLDRAVLDSAFDYDPSTFEVRAAPGWSARALEETVTWLDTELAAASGMRLPGVWHFQRRQALKQK
ncbi:MAG: radical SAM protein [Polyangiaceae bacterium]|nr:radical SAM protein [Polyangiaceae bacterium]